MNRPRLTSSNPPHTNHPVPLPSPLTSPRSSTYSHEYYHSRPPRPSTNNPYDEVDTEDAEDVDEDMTYQHPRSGAAGANSGSATSRPGSSSKDSGGISKKSKSKPTKVFQCSGYGDCTMQFTRSEHLARHIRKHTGERPFHCDCGRNFSRLDNLRQHITTVHAQQFPPPASNAPPARQQSQPKTNGGVSLSAPTHRSNFKNKHRPGPLTLPSKRYSDVSPPGSPRYKAYSATAAQFPVTYHDPPPSPLATASGNFSGTNPSWHRAPLSAIGPLSGGSTSSSSASSSSYFSGHFSPPATATFPSSPSTAYYSTPGSATFITHRGERGPYDEKLHRRQTWHEGEEDPLRLPPIRTIWDGDGNDLRRGPSSPQKFSTSYLRRSPASATDPRHHHYFSHESRRSSLPMNHPDHKSAFVTTPEEDVGDYPMKESFARRASVTFNPETKDDDVMQVDSKKITSIADLCHPVGQASSQNSASGMGDGDRSGMELLSRAAVALIDH